MKFTKVNIQLLTDLDQYKFYEKGIRGRISQIAHPYAKANNCCYYYDDKIEQVFKLSKKEAEKKGIYDPKKLLSYILYLDANNLYGWAMNQKLSIGNHEWLSEQEIRRFNKPKNILKYNPDGEFTYDLVLEIPEKLHNFFNDYAPAPNHEAASSRNLSTFQNDLINE